MTISSRPKVILICGPLGSGKSAALQIVGELGYETAAISELVHAALQPGGKGYDEILARFGPQMLQANGQIDPVKLNRAARSDAGAGAAFRAIIAPLVRLQLEEFVRASRSSAVFVATSSPEAYALEELADQVWVLCINDEARISNLIEQHGWSRDAAVKMVRGDRDRMPAAPLADVALRGDSPGALRQQITDELRAMDSEPFSVTATREAGLAAGRGISATAATEISMRTAVQEAPARATSKLTSPGAPELPASDVIAQAGVAAPSAEPISLGKREFRLVFRRLVSSAVILAVIAFLTSWGLILAQYGREHLPIRPMAAAWQAAGDTINYVVAHPATYVWSKVEVPWTELVGATLGHSAGLLLLSMTAAVLLGFPLGMAAARIRRGPASVVVLLISVAGASTPSFFLGMILWAVNIWVHNAFDMKVLPATGFGWDLHVVMPALVLAMRPLAQVAQITYISVQEVLGQDYVRTAHSKGLTWSAVQYRHLLPNILIPILNTLGTSLRYSLASLPIVEIFFNWPGVGMRLLDAIDLGIAPLVIDLILSLGLFFLVVNLLIEFSFPLIDPRLRADATEESRSDAGSVMDWARQAWDILTSAFGDLRARAERKGSDSLPPLPSTRQATLSAPEAVPNRRRFSMLRNTLRNPAFVVGLLMLVILGALALLGEKLPGVDPYQVHGVMAVGGEYSAPPFKPSPEFPWGSDHIGRDMRALVLAGARRTLTLVLFGMLARVVVGAALGLLAGWQRGSWFDRLIVGATGVWAAFPATLFAMIVIQALGIQQGMWVFVAAISVVGWGEVAQVVRGQVAALKPQAFVESARSIGARSDQVLLRHVLPNLINPLTVMAALEMGGILMLLAELGFLNIFMGGGFRAIIGEAGGMVPIVATYSDVPEWSALIANVRQYWRSYPWMALYPGLAVFASIMAFNLFGEGLRRFLQENAIGLGRFLNRYTVLAAAGLALIFGMILRSTAPLNQYRPDALRLEEARVMEDIRVLSESQLQGRETGTAGADLAAIYVARRMEEIGLAPGGERNGYYQRLVQPRTHLTGMPTLAVLDGAGNLVMQWEYRKDFAEIARYASARGQARAAIMGAAYGPSIEGEDNGQFGLSSSAAMDHVLIVRAEDFPKVVTRQLGAVLVIVDSKEDLLRRDVFPYVSLRSEDQRPIVAISPETAEELLSTAGTSLAELDRLRSTQAMGTMQLSAEGAVVDVSVPADRSVNLLDEAYINVMGVIPGEGYLTGLQSQVIVVGAYYDGVGTDPLGVVYPGANDNASGVALMLELARLLKTSSYQPEKTVLFVAWAGGERQEGLSIKNILNARPGANELTVETVIELSGVGYGTGDAISIGNDSSYRLVQLFQNAAARYDAHTTTMGRGPHYDLPIVSIFGGRDATTLSLSWDGSDSLVHTPADTFQLMDPAKLRQVGRSAYITLLVLSRETEY
ncbi:MAG TPA: dephospho-CoA kinase [Anaerolineales bacterium]